MGETITLHRVHRGRQAHSIAPTRLEFLQGPIISVKGAPLAKLIYSAITSLDGYVADEDGNFDWAAPDEEVHSFVNDLERAIGTYLYGRRMYETLVVWETMDTDAPVMQDYAEIWRASDKIVYSTTLQSASSARTRIERTFDPDAIRQMKSESSRDISVGGPALAAEALAAGLVDECHLFLSPIVVGGGNPSLPRHLRLELELMDERRFGNGVVHVHYRVGEVSQDHSPTSGRQRIPPIRPRTRD
jgi:dihydrofolate reductase